MCFPRIARDTVETCTPRRPASSDIVYGFMGETPSLKKSAWASTMAPAQARSMSRLRSTQRTAQVAWRSFSVKYSLSSSDRPGFSAMAA